MRAPIYNDRGQFRYSDFVAYIPDFLKSEPDVVTLLQVFSDYINNAYRNIDTIEKFEFAMTTRVDQLTRVTKRMEYLRALLDLAAARSDRVNLLSVPRSNVKSNDVFGQDTGYTPYVVNYDVDEVEDTIENATMLMPSISGFGDGDVIFVNYDAIPDVGEIAYYFDKQGNRLVRDPMGNSQDPFTGTPNRSARVLSFNVSDVSAIKTRYGYTSEHGNRYKEVFFTAKILDVKSENSVREVTLPGGTVALVDYYGTELSAPGKMRTVIRFDGESGWNWKNGFPSAIIYLSETSGAGLANVSGENSICLPAANCTDPAYLGTIPRYPVTDISGPFAGVLTVSLSTCYPAYRNGTVYLAKKSNLEIIGEFNVLNDSRESGTLDVRLVPTGVMPEIDSSVPMVLMDVPLFYGRGVLDYTKASPLLNIAKNSGGDLESVDGTPMRLVPNDRMAAYACEVINNPVIGTLTPGQWRLEGGYTIVVPFDSELVKNFGTLFDLGSRIYIDSPYPHWDGLAIVKSFSMVDDGYALTLEGINGAIRLPMGEFPRTVRVVRGGYVTVSSELGGYDTDVNKTEFPPSGVLSECDGIVILTDADRKETVARMNAEYQLDRDIPDGTYTVSIIRKTADRVRKLVEVTDGETYWTTVWERHRGDMFTRPYVMIEDSAGNVAIHGVTYDPGEEVGLAHAGEYAKGEYVYDPVTGRVFMCIDSCIVEDVNGISYNTSFTEDHIKHYSVPYVERFNAFMPYYGPIAAMEYGERINYDTDPEVFTSPLYITKVEEKTLKYGWEHRDFLNYGDMLNLSGRARNGMVEFHSTERTGAAETLTVDSAMDIVNSDLLPKSTWSYPHPVITRGCASSVAIDIDDPMYLSAERLDLTRWKVTVHSAAHGLVDGSMVTVTGIAPASIRGEELDFNVAFAPVVVVDGDVFTYEIEGDPGLSGSTCYAAKQDGAVTYIGDHNVRIETVADIAGTTVHLRIANPVYTLRAGDSLYLEGCRVSDGTASFPAGPYGIVSVDDDLRGLTIDIGTDAVPVLTSVAYLRKPIAQGDVVVITDADGTPKKFYEVDVGMWREVERNGLIVPFDIFSQTNMFDISDTNPPIALGDPLTIRTITYNGDGTATVCLADPLLHFIPDNRRFIEGKTVVYISNVTPSDYCGFHVVERVHSPYSFDMGMRLYNTHQPTGIPTSDLTMQLRECRWYKFTADEIEWDKISSQATFTGKNVTEQMSIDSDGIRLKTRYEHGLAPMDMVVFGYDFSAFDETTGLGNYAMGKVVSVPNSTSVVVEVTYGTYHSGMSIARGIITMPGMDNLANREGEYQLRLESLSPAGLPSMKWTKYRFMDGDIIIAAGQQVPSERMSYLVREGARWTVLKKKRIVKVRKMMVDEYRNPYFDDAAADANVDEYKYVTYSDVDVAANAQRAYASRMYMVRNPVFNRPALPDIDTTRDPNAEYSSNEDYANVAPRDGMKSSFHGVPDMKYPLIEKIERLAYLRDANVIDFDLIGYLARFMGYDLTPMAEDIESSNLYRTITEQEKAIREAVLNLPQYYALGGTGAGLKMLMGAFGVIGDVLTLYTNTMHPYEEMLSEAEVKDRLRTDTMEGTLEGSWVSTPYVDIELTDDARFPQFAIQPDDIGRIREQIRVWKPINVVFRDVLLKYVDEIEMNLEVVGPVVGVTEFGAALVSGHVDDGVDVDELETNQVIGDIEYADPGLTNCAF